MQKTNGKKKNKRKIRPIKKPYLKGSAMSALVAKRGLKMLVYAAVFLMLNLFIGALYSFDDRPFLRVLFNGMLILVYGAVLYMDGLRVGDGDVAFAEIQYNHAQQWQTITKQEKDRCFHPLKGVTTVLCGMAIPLILAVVFALTAQKQTYTLQALPSWVSSYGARDFTLPLQYYYQTQPVTALSVLKIVMHLAVYPFINIVGARNAEGILLIDRLSPLLILIPFLFYAVGYVRGLHSRAMLHGSAAMGGKRRGGAKKKQAKKPRSEQKELV